MTFKEITDSKLFIVAVLLGGMMLMQLVSQPILVKKTTKSVIEELRSGRYTPGPYAPGFDPDMIDPNTFRQKAPVKAVFIQPDWQDSWEADRVAQ